MSLEKQTSHSSQASQTSLLGGPSETSTAFLAYAALRDKFTSELVKVRSLFEATYAREPSAYHPIDVERVRNDDWQVLRFLEKTPQPREAFKKLNETLLWKKSIGVHERRDDDFPREFYQLNGIEVLGRHPESGHLILWITSKYDRNLSDTKPYLKNFTVHETEFMDQLGGPYGVVVVADSKHVTLFSIELELTRYLQDIVSTHYPGIIRMTLVFNLSWFLDPIYRIILAFLDADLRATMQVVSESELRGHIPLDFIPEEHGGQRKTRVIRQPETAPGFMDCPMIELTEEQKKYDMSLFKGLGIE